MRLFASASMSVLLVARLACAGDAAPQQPPPPIPPKDAPAPGAEPKSDPKPDPKAAESAARLAKLLRDFNSPDAAVREAAAKDVMTPLQEQIKNEKRPYVGALNEELKDADAAKRETGAKKVGAAMEDLRKGHEKGLYEMFALIDSGDPASKERGRVLLVSRISDVLEGALVAKLIEDLASSDKAVVQGASKTLLEIGAAAGGQLVDALEDDRMPVSKGCHDVLKALGPKIKENASDLAFLLDSDNKWARRFAGGILENLGPDAAETVDDLVQYLEHDEKPVRRSAANILKKIGAAAKEGVPELIELLTHDEKNVRSLAQEVLVGLEANAVEGTEALAEIVSDATDDPDGHDVLLRAAAVLTAIGPPAKAALPALKKQQEIAQPLVKDAIAAAIKKLEAKDEGIQNSKVKSQN